MTCFTGSAPPPEAGCSALAWHTGDGKSLWGRNYDFDRLAEGARILVLPRGTPYRLLWAGDSGGEDHTAAVRYACAGTGLLLGPAPVLYEGLNEAGLMGGQLYYRGFAHYGEGPAAGARPIQPPFLVLHLLAQCATVEEAVRCLEKELRLVPLPLLGTVPPLHWSFSDRTGESIVVEPDREGLHIYRNTLGVMTNSPGYPWHRLNLLNYAGLRDLDHPGTHLAKELEQCFSGSGAQGLPGDWSSPSRFVRLAFLRAFAPTGEGEASGVARMFRLLQSAAFPLGAVRVSHQSPVTEQDTHTVPYDYTVYTSVCCAQSRRFYWTTYENQRIRYLELEPLLERPAPLQFPLYQTPDFLPVTDLFR